MLLQWYFTGLPVWIKFPISTILEIKLLFWQVSPRQDRHL